MRTFRQIVADSLGDMKEAGHLSTVSPTLKTELALRLWARLKENGYVCVPEANIVRPRRGPVGRQMTASEMRLVGLEVPGDTGT